MNDRAKKNNEQSSSFVFTGDTLSEIAFPLGGIGTGTVSLGGRGELRDWEIFNSPAKGNDLDYAFFALWAKKKDESPVVRILEGKYTSPYRSSGRRGGGYSGSGHGMAVRRLSGLQRLDGTMFRGEYPFAWVDFIDTSLPVKVALHAWNPLIPLNVKDSSLPVAVFYWTFENLEKQDVEVSLAAAISNPIGDTYVNVRGEKHGLGGNLNEYKKNRECQGLFLTSLKIDRLDPAFGSMALATSWKDMDVQTRWYRGGWWDKVHIFWEEFSQDGRLVDVRDAIPSEMGKTDYGCLALRASIPPGGHVTLPVVLAWYFPNRENYWNRAETIDIDDYWHRQEEVCGKVMKNYVDRHFQNAWDVACYTFSELSRLESDTRRFHDTLFSSTVPDSILDAASSQISTLRSNTCMLLEDGSFFGFEGTNDDSGSCPLNCTHVWNYAQTPAFLFPELERSMRETDFLHNTLPNGHMAFRSLVPLGQYWWKYKPAVDGQMGSIIRLYRDWQLSGDTEWLRMLWPKVKLALEFAWKGCGHPPPKGLGWTADYLSMPWDPEKRGVIEGEQHNAYDIEFYGPKTMTGSLYLGALKAAAEMADALGERVKSEEYQGLFESGKQYYDKYLWNGEYYFQDVKLYPGLRLPESLHSPQPIWLGSSLKEESGTGSAHVVPKYQYGTGCLSDQLLGQYLAHVAGLGYVLDRDHVRAAIKSVFSNNYRASLNGFANVQRVFALNDEAGLLLCSWPRGGRQVLPFVYSDEVWSGVEYQVAATLIYNGWVDEGIQVVESVRDRHKGYNRNPWDEEECGHHYVRAMSSWAVYLAMAGFHYSGVRKTMTFSPAIRNGDFRTFWSTGSGWGHFSQILSGEKASVRLHVQYGSLSLKRLSLGILRRKDQSLEVAIGDCRIRVRPDESSETLAVDFPQSVDLAADDVLMIALS